MLLGVHLLSIDESGQPGERAFAVGGVVVEAGGWGLLRDRWHGAVARHGWAHDKEVKWHGTRTGEVPPAVADAVFGALAGTPITC